MVARDLSTGWKPLQIVKINADELLSRVCCSAQAVILRIASAIDRADWVY
jgi:hypothetical protein